MHFALYTQVCKCLLARLVSSYTRARTIQTRFSLRSLNATFPRFTLKAQVRIDFLHTHMYAHMHGTIYISQFIRKTISCFFPFYIKKNSIYYLNF